MTAAAVEPVESAAEDGPAAWWRELAPGLAGRRRVRLYRPAEDGTGGGYEVVRALSRRLPAAPAALLLYDEETGRARALALDFDCKLGAAAAQRDAGDAAEWFASLGGRVIVDRSPRGGWHVWVPLAAPAPAEQLAPLVRALAAYRWPTLDASPVGNVKAGCLTGPGSACRHDQGGGHRHLVTPFAEALSAVRIRSHPELLDRAAAKVVATYGPLPAHQDAADDGVDELPDELTHATARAVRRPLSGLHTAIAAGGEVPAGRYVSTSEACWAVLRTAACRGWSLGQVAAELHSGRWGGLAALYQQRAAARTRRGGWRALLAYEWRRALGAAAKQPPTRDSSTPAQELILHRGAPTTGTERDHICRWYATVMTHVDQLGEVRQRTSLRVVLHAVAWLAWSNGTRYPDQGLRAYSLASGGVLDPDSIGDALEHLRRLPDQVCPVVCIERHDGHRGDRYELVIPPGLPTVEAARYAEPRPIEPIFGWRESGERQAKLGAAAWWLYQQLQHVEAAGASAGELAAAAELARSTVYRHLPLLARHGMATSSGVRERADEPATTWIAGPLSPASASDLHGADDWLAEQARAYAAERRVWRAWLTEQAELRATQPYEHLDDQVDAADPDAELWRELLNTAWHTDLERHDPGPDPHPDPGEAHEIEKAAVALLTETFDAVLVPDDPIPRPRWLGAAADPRRAHQVAAISRNIARRRHREAAARAGGSDE